MIKTRLGTVLTGVPVSWAVTSAGGGSVAPLTGFCGTYGASAATTTDVLGRAGICWRVGAPGTNTVQATPSAGGDAPAGVSFTPATHSFSVNAVVGVPARVEVVSGDSQTGVAGSTLAAPLVARITDDEGYIVAGANVHWLILEGGGSITPFGPTSGPTGLSSAQWTLGAPGANRAKVYINDWVFAYVYFNALATAP